MKAHPDFATRGLPKVASLPARSAQHWEWFDSGCRFNGPSGCLGKSDLSRASSRLALWIVRHQVNGEISLLKLPNGPPIDAVLCATKDGCEFGILHLFNSASVSAREGEEAPPDLLCEGSPMFTSLLLGWHDFGKWFGSGCRSKVSSR